jgi:putative transposase
MSIPSTPQIIIRAHKTRIYPTNKAKTELEKAFGCGRLAYNACLDEWNRRYKEGEKPNINEIKKWFNSIKKERYPYVTEVTKVMCIDTI